MNHLYNICRVADSLYWNLNQEQVRAFYYLQHNEKKLCFCMRRLCQLQHSHQIIVDYVHKLYELINAVLSFETVSVLRHFFPVPRCFRLRKSELIDVIMMYYFM